MNKWVEVLCTLEKIYMVEVEDSETVEAEAQQCIKDELMESGDLTFDEVRIVAPDCVESAKLSANKVLSL